MGFKEKIFAYGDEVLTLELKYDRADGYQIILDEYTYMVFGQGFWAKNISQVVFEKINEYIKQIIEENQVLSLDEKVTELFDEIGVQTCNEEGEPIYSGEKLKRLKEFVER